MVLEYWTIAIYMLFLVAMGYVQRKLNANISDYFRGGCQGTWWLVGTSTFMSGISAYTFTAAAGVAFESGWSAAIIYLANVVSFFFCFLFLAKWFRQLRAITTPDIIDMRFGRTTQQFYAWISVIQYTICAGLPLYALALFCSAVFGFNIYVVILVIGGIVLLYSTAGGKWAVMSNDFLQSLVLFSITVLVTVLTYKKVGGIEGFVDLIQENGLRKDFRMFADNGDFPDNSFTWCWAIAIFCSSLLAQNTLFSASKYFSVKDGKAASKAALLSCILMLIGAAFWFLPPMAARFFYADQVNSVNITKPSESAYAIIAMNILPNGMLGLVLVAMFAATMSSLDTGFNGTAAIVVRNIYPAIAKLFKKRELSESGQLRLAQVTTMVIGVVVIGIAVMFAANKQKGIFEIMLTITAVLNLPLAIPMLMCLFIRKVPSWAALFTVAVSFIPSLIGFFSEELFGQSWTFQRRMFWTISIGVTSFVATIPFWRFASAEYKQKVSEFFTLMHKPVDFEKEVGKSLDTQQFRTIGRFVMVLGGFIATLLLVPNELWGRLCVVTVAVFVFGVGWIMVYMGKRLSLNNKTKFANENLSSEVKYEKVLK